MNNIIISFCLLIMAGAIVFPKQQPKRYSKWYAPVETIEVNFTDAMYHYFKFHAYRSWTHVSNPKTLNFFSLLYQRNNLQKVTASLTSKIPKIIHQIWLGSPFPEQYKQYQQTWIKHHPDWEYKLWTDKDIEEFKLTNKRAFDKAPNYGEKSDILRYEILNRYGGLYIDVDCECLRPFTVFHHCYDFYVGTTNSGTAEINNAIIGAAPGHPIITYCIDHIEVGDGTYNVSDTLQRTGPIYLTDCFLKIAPDCLDTIIAFPVTFFYPLHHSLEGFTKRTQVQDWLAPESCAIHYSARSWQKQPLNTVPAISP
jgi:hypothetical protein